MGRGERLACSSAKLAVILHGLEAGPGPQSMHGGAKELLDWPRQSDS